MTGVTNMFKFFFEGRHIILIFSYPKIKKSKPKIKYSDPKTELEYYYFFFFNRKILQHEFPKETLIEVYGLTNV